MNLSIEWAVVELQVPTELHVRMKQPFRTYDEANSALDNLKKHVKQHWRVWASRNHPDKHGGCEACTDRFQRLSAVVDMILKAEIPKPRPIPMTTVWGSGGTATTSGGWRGF